MEETGVRVPAITTLTRRTRGTGPILGRELHSDGLASRLEKKSTEEREVGKRKAVGGSG